MTGDVNLLDTILQPFPDITPNWQVGLEFVLIRNDGTDAVNGRFSNFANDGDLYGVISNTTAYTFAIDYHYDANGDGANNDVALRLVSIDAVPEPGTGTLVAMAAAMALRSRALDGSRLHRMRASRSPGPHARHAPR